ncbi:MAG: ATP-binding protein [Myxococcales bacterium]|nr:ATP-binding protein [Myxococcales bacterium]
MGEAAVDGRACAGGVVSGGDLLAANAASLEVELDWLAALINARFAAYFAPEGEAAPSDALIEPPALDALTPYTRMLRFYDFGYVERVAIILALAPILRPQLLDVFHTRNSLFDRPFTEFGGRRTDGAFVPTGETLAFVLDGATVESRLRLRQLFGPTHVFRAHQLLAPAPAGIRDPLKTPLVLSEEISSLVLLGEPRRPNFGADFPAQYISTTLTWDDLVLHPGTRRQLDEILAWMEHGDTLLGDWGMAGRLRPGLRCLFYGPPGTGKSMTACLLGAAAGRDVYKIDLSLVVSKYIGETEKNLGRVFEQAENKDWILFFDEADALFGKRSDTRDAHDRYANQETAFLLQRLETFNGVAILASNLRDNIDAAFARRFESVIYFPVPRPEERRLLWERGFPAAAALDEGLDLDSIAQQHPLSGGSIMNVIRYASMEALRRGERQIRADDVRAGIRRELSKERKAV